MKKRAKTYDKKLELKDGVEFDDLVKLSLKPVDHGKKTTANRKRAAGKRK